MVSTSFVSYGANALVVSMGPLRTSPRVALLGKLAILFPGAAVNSGLSVLVCCAGCAVGSRSLVAHPDIVAATKAIINTLREGRDIKFRMRDGCYTRFRIINTAAAAGISATNIKQADCGVAGTDSLGIRVIFISRIGKANDMACKSNDQDPGDDAGSAIAKICAKLLAGQHAINRS
jgi:hypothetical protein